MAVVRVLAVRDVGRGLVAGHVVVSAAVVATVVTVVDDIVGETAARQVVARTSGGVLDRQPHPQEMKGVVEINFSKIIKFYKFIRFREMEMEAEMEIILVNERCLKTNNTSTRSI